MIVRIVKEIGEDRKREYSREVSDADTLRSTNRYSVSWKTTGPPQMSKVMSLL